MKSDYLPFKLHITATQTIIVLSSSNFLLPRTIASAYTTLCSLPDAVHPFTATINLTKYPPPLNLPNQLKHPKHKNSRTTSRPLKSPPISLLLPYSWRYPLLHPEPHLITLAAKSLKRPMSLIYQASLRPRSNKNWKKYKSQNTRLLFTFCPLIQIFPSFLRCLLVSLVCFGVPLYSPVPVAHLHPIRKRTEKKWSRLRLTNVIRHSIPIT